MNRSRRYREQRPRSTLLSRKGTPDLRPLQGRGLLAFACLFLLPFLAFTQNSIFTTDTFQVKAGDTIQLSNKPLVPASFRIDIDGIPLGTAAFSIDLMEGKIVLFSSIPEGKMIVRYRYFSRFLATSYSFRQLGDTSARGESTRPGIATKQNNQFLLEEYLEESNLRKSGSISRGITVGNKQSLTVSSGLNLQVDGELGDDIRLMAAITDENIPIQPDGTTQQIQDFDKVFLKFMKGDHGVILGDFEIAQRNTFFADFYRNVQGIGVNIDFPNYKASVNGAVAKGKFHTNSFQGQDGKQGPYRLAGRNNERFIIVLAGSEKVYLNGKLVTRGEGNDYTIDYNSGEVYFTSQTIITSAIRIVVDFEYTDRYYNRSLLFANGEASLAKNRVKIGVSYGRDADNKNAPVDLEFGEAEKAILQLAGDDPLKAAVTGVDTVTEFSESRVLYERLDTLVDSVLYERYIRSTDPEKALYSLTFTYVGPGNGFYTRTQNTANGIVFLWNPPGSAGLPVGDYAPIRILALPRELQVADIRVSYKPHQKVRIYTEGALSSEDQNRFSPIDDEDNIGLANKTGLIIDRIRLTDSLTFKVDVSHKYIGQRYQNIDRINKVEYGREWNFDEFQERKDENVSEAVLQLNYKNQLKVTANAGVRLMGKDLTSIKQLYKLESEHKWLQGKYQFTTISTDNRAAGTFSRWDRHNGDIYKNIGKFRPGVEIWMENKRDLDADTVSSGSFRFYDFKPYLKTIDWQKFEMLLYGNVRFEQEFKGGVLRNKSLAHQEYLKVIYNPISNVRLQSTASFRDFMVQDSLFFADGFADKRNFITNLQGTFYDNKRIAYTNLIYEVTSEQIARKDVVYVRTNPGQGNYEWTDINTNGVEELDEFQISTNPLLADYVRVTIPTRDLFPSTGVNFSGNLKLDFQKIYDRSKKPMKELLRNFLAITNFRVIQKREADNSLKSYLVSFNNFEQDTTLLEAQFFLKQDVYFFRNNPLGDIRFSVSDNRTRQFLSSGNEVRSSTFFETAQRLNFGKKKSLENKFKFGDKITKAELLLTRNFNIRFYEIEPKMNFQLSRKVRLTGGYAFKHKTNKNDSAQVVSTVQIHKAIIDARWNISGRNNLFTKVELIYVSEEGQSNFSADYEMKESLKSGFNTIWQIFFTYYLSKNLELSLNYDGRYTGESQLIHSGRISLKAFF